MNLIEKSARWALLTRVSEWHDKALAVVVCAIILVLFEAAPEQHFGLIAAIAIYVAFLGSYGYSLNSYCDREQDGKIGRRQVVAAFTESEFRIAICISASGVMAVLLWLSDSRLVVTGLFAFLLATFYSARPIRFKERGVFWNYSGGNDAKVAPFRPGYFFS